MTKFCIQVGYCQFFQFIKDRGHDEDTGDLCACEYVNRPWKFGGCRIDEPAPLGYKCFCSKFEIIHTCNGRGQKCKSANELGCNGCMEKECCAGSCEAYDFYGK